MAFNNGSTSVVLGHQTYGTFGMFGRDAVANALTLLAPNLLDGLDCGGQISHLLDLLVLSS